MASNIFVSLNITDKDGGYANITKRGELQYVNHHLRLVSNSDCRINVKIN